MRKIHLRQLDKITVGEMVKLHEEHGAELILTCGNVGVVICEEGVKM